MQLDEGVHMETMLEHLVQPTPEMDRAQQIENQLGADDMANTHVLQEVFSIVDELVIVLENMPKTFEGDAKDGPPTNGMGTTNVNDEDSGADLVGLQEACQTLYPNARSTKLTTTMLLMNICTVHGVSNKFVDELLSLLHRYLLPPNNCLLSNMHHAKTLTKKVGLNYHIIHVCPNGCICFKRCIQT
jgi:hypothetical protein